MRRLFFICLAFVLLLPMTKINAATSDLEIFQKLQNRITAVSKKVVDNVVHIKVVVRLNQREIVAGGSGILIDNKGHIITNQHVVENAESVRVYLKNVKKPYYAKIIGEDRQTDIALIQIDLAGKKITPPLFGNAEKLKVGQWVIAVGNPYGLEGTVSFGIISAIGRNLPVGFLINNFIQTDAMIDFGSSGGPLIDLYGRVIGINSRGQGRGIGFTVPVDTVLKVVEDFKKSGIIERAWLGIIVQPFSRDMAEYFKIPNQGGVIINATMDKSPAEKIGLKAGDILVEFNGKKVEAEDEKEIKEVIRLIANNPIGKKVKLKVIRNGKKKTFTAKLAKQPKIDADEEESKLGFNAKEITIQIYLSHLLDNKEGVLVSYVEPGSIAARGNLLVGDVVKTIEGQKVKTLGDFKRLMKKYEDNEKILIVVRRGRNTSFVLLKKENKVEKANKEITVN